MLVARIAGGLYAGRHARDVQSAYRHIVDEVLCEEMGSTTVPRGRFFEEVTIVDLGAGRRPARGAAPAHHECSPRPAMLLHRRLTTHRCHPRPRRVAA